jgi:hypothetical protein
MASMRAVTMARMKDPAIPGTDPGPPLRRGVHSAAAAAS